MAHHLLRCRRQPVCPRCRLALSHLPLLRVCVKPGCKVYHMLVLEEPQGDSKIVGSLHIGRPMVHRPTLKSREQGCFHGSRGCVGFIEVSELDALSKARHLRHQEVHYPPHERYRRPYGKHVGDQPRQCVFAGTIDPNGPYLKDPTGARRIWPVVCGVVDLDGLRRDRDQLWAEAVVRFR